MANGNHLNCFVETPSSPAAVAVCSRARLAQMLGSLQRLAALPPDTRIWCAHEYTAKNVAFALAQDPHNPHLQAFAHHVEQLRQVRLPTIPSRLEVELRVNPFLRCHAPALQAATGKTDPVEVLAELRQRRNRI